MQVRLTGELEEITGECDRFSTNGAILEKRGRNFDKVISEWKAKGDDLGSEIQGGNSIERNLARVLVEA